MKVASQFLFVGLTIIGFAGTALAAPKPKTPPDALPAPLPVAGPIFNGTGKVSLFRGAPCTSQIMFDLRVAHAREPVFLAAHVKESDLLTEAARKRRTVQISGTWQHGREKTCRFVTVTHVVVQKGFFSW